MPWPTHFPVDPDSDTTSHQQARLLKNQPRKFDFSEFFLGHTRASGWFSDRFGKPRRHFCGDFYGFHEGDNFILDEKLFYTDGVMETRRWVIKISENGMFSAKSETLINGASGFVDGNRLTMRYSMKVKVAEDKSWDLDIKDLMVLQPDGSLHNIADVCKWGFKIGTVCTQYLQHAGDKQCVNGTSFGSRMAGSEPIARYLSSVRS